MIGRQVIETNRAFTLEELEKFMKERWNTHDYNSFFIGKPTQASVEEYILLPATPRYMVIVYSRAAGGFFSKQNKVILSVADTPAGALTKLATCLPKDNIFYDAWVIGETLSSEKERKGPAEETLLRYADYMKGLLKEAGFTK